MLNFVTMVGVILQYFTAVFALQYDDLWQGSGAGDESNMLMQAMASNNLIFVVLAVSLVIWFVFIFYLMRVERKLAQLEKKHSE
jgi:preprotein translocase subunit SecY